MLRKNPDHVQAHYQLGLLWLELGEWNKAERELQQARDDEDTQTALLRLEHERGKLGNSYARHLFNDYAPRFEESLARLDYQIPQRMAVLLRPYLRSSQRIIDLGCGTGLMAPYLKPHAAELVGVDIAEKMLAVAAQRKLYDRLEATDMVAALRGQWDVITAADAVVYIGDLLPFMQAAVKTLSTGGVLAISVEVNGLEQGYILQESRRHAHSLSYITAITHTCGLQVSGYHEVIVRQDRGQPVKGAILIISPTIEADSTAASPL